MEEAESVDDCPVEDPLGREEEDGKEEEAGGAEDAISEESVEESVLEAPADKIEEEEIDISGVLEDGRLDSEVEKDAVVEGLKVEDAKEVSEKEMLEAGPDVDDSRDVEASGEDGEDEGPVEADVRPALEDCKEDASENVEEADGEGGKEEELDDEGLLSCELPVLPPGDDD